MSTFDHEDPADPAPHKPQMMGPGKDVRATSVERRGNRLAPNGGKMNDHAAGASPVDRTVRPAAEARWYCLDRDGVAMLCKDEADARAQVIENDDLWPARAPHRAALLCDLEYLRDGGDFIPLAQPRNEQAKRTAELCLSAWATARMDALEAKNAALAREAHTWWTACRDATGEVERLREVAARMVAGIDHLDKLAREWEPEPQQRRRQTRMAAGEGRA